MSRDLPSLQEAKAMAKRVRAGVPKLKGASDQQPAFVKQAEAKPMTHAQSLEVVAQHHGFRDWNTFKARIDTVVPHAFTVGARVSGRYLSQRFTAQIVSSQPVETGWFRLSLQFDAPVDVVASEAFSNHRQRVSGVIGPKGHTAERTSDGVPHIVLDL